MVSDPERDRALVQDLLQLKEKLDRVLNQAFGASEPFSHALKESFECFINIRQVSLKCKHSARGLRVAFAGRTFALAAGQGRSFQRRVVLSLERRAHVEHVSRAWRQAC